MSILQGLFACIIDVFVASHFKWILIKLEMPFLCHAYRLISVIGLNKQLMIRFDQTETADLKY